MRRLHYLLAGLVVVCLLGCLDEIELESPDQPDEALVIQGRVVGGSVKEIEVRLERAFQFTGSNRPDRVLGATVVIRNSQDEELMLRYSTTEGTYQPDPDEFRDFTVAPGLSYSLHITLRDGRRLESTQVPLLETVSPSSVTVEPVQVERQTAREVTLVPGLSFSVNTSLSSEAKRLRWTTFESYRYEEVPTHPRFRDNDGRTCYITQREIESGSVRLVDATELRVDSLEDFELARVPIDFKQHAGYVVSVYQEALDVPTYDYFAQIDEAITREASLFEPPAGVIQSNIRFLDSDERVIGYFYAVDREVIHTYIVPQPDSPMRCPLPPSGSPFPAPNLCDDCVDIAGASLIRPSYFPL